ncbi:hypothetical protein [Nocardioides sp. B-3]|uniref:hypothetical protein n=1 Tax=Nocardioides sp. B-3 TaxID=2895565 RepID=UPI002152B452|nr:hypothetical protein [Nocardioides sp. B-3]UUZ58636.1 hypothetical protein LP418_21275 [Nocardioides sp. B-3]
MTRTPGPRSGLNGLVGMLIVGLVAALAATCSGRNTPDVPSEAETFKAEMDTEAARLLPDLMEAVGGRLGGMQATYYERGGFGIWDYAASGGILDPAASTTDSLAASAAVLADHGYTVETDDEQRRVRGDKGEIVVPGRGLTAEGRIDRAQHQHGQPRHRQRGR